MSNQIFAPGPTPDTVSTTDGRTLTPPAGWVLLPPGDAALTRRVKATGEFWAVQEKKGRKVFSRGIWADGQTIEAFGKELEAERGTESYAKKKAADARRREKAQVEYVEDFQAAVIDFLAFHAHHQALADTLAKLVTELATPVGSGTVARTQRIPIERRAEAAVIAWLRHQTTGYDDMIIARVKGKRREVRRMLAQRSHALLSGYRRGDAIAPGCPLQAALSG
jgi:plasmid stabilization system protein ParE